VFESPAAGALTNVRPAVEPNAAIALAALTPPEGPVTAPSILA